MAHTHYLLTLGALVVSILPACTAERPGTREYVTEPDASVPQRLESPLLIASTPNRTPLASVAVRGTAAGTRIIVTGGASGPLVKMPLPSGDFCVDVPVGQGETTRIKIVALESGMVSLPTEHVVVHDPTAPQPAAPYCDPPACNGKCPATEVACSDGNDDDLDGWTDDCDPDCNGCDDDAFEPNAYPIAVPLLPLDRTHQLRLCPCHDDWLAVFLRAGSTLEVELTGDDPGLNVDMKLFRPEDAEKDGYKTATALQQAVSPGSEEHLSWEADKAGIYYLHVFTPDPKRSGGYQLRALVSEVTP